MHILKIDLNIYYVIYGQACCFDDSSYILKRLANLFGKVGRSAPVRPARSLPGHIYIISRVNPRRA
jgi:hypothetical protein